MFRLNEVYETANGQSVRIICVDANAKYGNTFETPIVGLVTSKGMSYANAVYLYSKEGKYCGATDKSFEPYHLISTEPTEEELSLIQQIGNYCEGSVKDREEALLKIVRQLRRK